MENGNTKTESYYIKLFRYLYTNQQKYVKAKKNDEEFYYADVEETRTQFTKEQLEMITQKYDIPISTKLNYAITEAFRANLTATDPYPRLIAVEEKFKEWVSFWERVLSSIWYESDISTELDGAIKDMAVTGSGFMHIRTNTFYKESTFNVIAEHIPWNEVYVDPACKKADLSDADFVCIARSKPIYKLEQEYGITIDEDDVNMEIVDPHVPSSDIPYNFPDFGFSGESSDKVDRKKTKWAWEKLFYESATISEYIADNGGISIIMPIKTAIPNEQKQQLGMMIQQMQTELSNGVQGQTGDPAVDGPALEAVDKAGQQIEAMQAEYLQMPDFVPKFKFVSENGQTYYVDNFVHQKQKRFYQILQIEKKIMFKKLLPTDVLPLVHLTFAHFRNAHKTYGVTHFIKDFVKGINKLWSLVLYDAQLKASLRVIAPETAIEDLHKWEQRFSVPGSINTYVADPTLNDGGKPEIIDLGSTQSQMPQLISMLLQLAEYVSGLFGLMQGNSENAPPTFGATQSMQNFGSQRIKLTARGIERPLNLLLYNLLVYAQRYAPFEKLALVVDEQAMGDPGAVIASASEARYKVRTVLTNNLPTTRQMASQMFTILAGQVADPMVQKLLIQEGLRLLDLRESDRIVKDIDTISQMQQQMGQMQEQIQQSEGQMQTMTQNMAQQKIALEVEKAKGNIKATQASAETQIQDNVTNTLEATNV